MLLALAAVLSPTNQHVPILSGALVITFALLLKPRAAISVFVRAMVVAAPLCIFLYVIWVVFVGHAPENVLFGTRDGTLSVRQYVVGIAARVFLMVLLVSTIVEYFSETGPLLFVRSLRVPLRGKVLLLLTLSLKHTIAIAATRAFSALVAANVLTPRISIRNALGSWRLIQTVWVASLGLALERLDTKWKYEQLPESRAGVLSDESTGWSAMDVIWISGALIVAALTAFSGLP